MELLWPIIFDVCLFLGIGLLAISITRFQKNSLQKGAATLGPVLRSMATDRDIFNKAISELRKHSLLERDPTSHMLSVHQILQVVLKAQLDKKAHRHWAECAVRAVSKTFPRIRFPLQQHDVERLLPHVHICQKLIDDENLIIPEAADLLSQAGLYFFHRFQDQQAKSFYEHAWKIYAQLSNAYASDRARILNYLAIFDNYQNNYQQAETLYQSALKILEGKQEPGTRIRLASLISPFLTLVKGKLEIKKRMPNVQHPDLARTLNNLANLCQKQGNYKQAEIHYQRALQIKEQLLGPYHPDMAATLNNLANLYQQRGLYKQAESFYQQALTIYERVLGNDHHHTKTVQKNYAYLLLRQIKQKKVTDRDNRQ